MIEYVYVPRRRGKRASRSRENYRGRFKLPGMVKLDDVALHTTDRRIAEARLREIVVEKERELAGILAPRVQRDAAARPLVDHLDDFIADVKARRRSKEYFEPVKWRIRRLMKECGWSLLRDVSAESFIAWRSRQGDTMSAKTLNEYLSAARGLLGWLHRQGKIAGNPLTSVERVQTAGRERRKRRALTVDECVRLLAVAGPRRTAYLAALVTGLRRSELEALEWGDVHLDSPSPFLDVRASTTKNARRAAIAIRDDLAEALRAIRPADAASSDRVFPRGVPSVAELHADCTAAEIPIQDGDRGSVDFHALRHTFGTNLSRAKVGPRVAMAAMRHSDMKLTMRTYTDADLLPVTDAIERLPRFDAMIDSELRATGTDGADAPEMRSQMRSLPRVAGGRWMSPTDADASLSNSAKVPENRHQTHAKSSSDAIRHNAPSTGVDGNRTHPGPAEPAPHRV